MFYISRIGKRSFGSTKSVLVTVTDSETGWKFIVMRVGGGRHVRYYRNGKRFDMLEVLGYVDGDSICCVPLILLDF